MSTSPRFFFDENIHLAVAEGLRRLEYDALHAREANMLMATDEEIMEAAIGKKRILVTRDVSDFSQLARFYINIGRSFPGILHVPPSIPHKDPGALIDALEKWANKYGNVEQISGGIAWLSPAESEDGDRRIRETEPSYLRALRRIGATV